MNPRAAFFFLAIASCTSADDPTSASTGATSSTTTTGATTGTSTATTGAGGGLEPPADLVDYLTGDDADAAVTPLGPGLILMGGGADVDAAFTWWKPKLAGGDVVVLRASGADGYNDYLFSDIGGADSVETMLVTTAALANAPYVADRVARAEGIFIAGGDQAVYMEAWKGTALEDALRAAWARGAILGGTSAGCAVLGSIVFTAANGSVYSDEALTDPFNRYMTLDADFLGLAPTSPLVLDMHFHERDRMGRLVGFMARAITDGLAADVRGVGVDEATALVVEPSGAATVLGSGHVYVVDATDPPTTCAAGQPLEWQGLALTRLAAGDTVQLPLGPASVPAVGALGASGGVTAPADPY